MIRMMIIITKMLYYLTCNKHTKGLKRIDQEYNEYIILFFAKWISS